MKFIWRDGYSTFHYNLFMLALSFDSCGNKIWPPVVTAGPSLLKRILVMVLNAFIRPDNGYLWFHTANGQETEMLPCHRLPPTQNSWLLPSVWLLCSELISRQCMYCSHRPCSVYIPSYNNTYAPIIKHLPYVLYTSA